MNSRKKQILILFTVWAGLLIVVLYSPIGSPELYGPASCYTAGSSVNSARSTEITDIHSPANFRASGTTRITTHSAPFVEMNNPAAYSLAGSTSGKEYGVGSYGGDGSGIYAHKSGISTGTFSGSGLNSFGGFSPKSLASGSNVVGTDVGGTTALGTDLMASGNQLLGKQGVTQGINENVDPGGGGGTQIPIGDGWFFLFVLLGIYVVWKRLF